MKNKMKKLGVLAVLLTVSTTSVEASKWVLQDSFQDENGCVYKHYTCERGFGLAFCDVGSNQWQITCPPGVTPNAF